MTDKKRSGVRRRAEDDPEGLRRTIRDLVAMSTLPAVWSRSGVAAIAESQADLMVRTLGLEMVYIRAPGVRPGEVIEAGYRRSQAVTGGRLQALGRALAPLLDAEDPRTGVPIVNPLGSGSMYPALVRFGSPSERGALFAGSMDSGFPSAHDRLILGVSVNLMALMHQRSRAEAALRDSERRYAVVTELLPQLIWVTDPEGKIEFVNRRWVEFTGRSAGDLIAGQPVLHPDDENRVLTAWARSRKEGTHFETEYRLRAADGHYEWFLAQAVPDLDEKGRIVKWYGSCTNIDAQRRSRVR